MTRESMGGGRRGPANFDFEAYMKAQQLRTAAAEFLKNEGVALIIHGSGKFNVPTVSGNNYKSGDKEPIAEINLPIEAQARIKGIYGEIYPGSQNSGPQTRL